MCAHKSLENTFILKKMTVFVGFMYKHKYLFEVANLKLARGILLPN